MDSRLRLVLAFALLAGLITGAPGVLPPASAANVHDAVWQYRIEHPGGRVPVIVQTGADSDPASVVRSLGGDVRYPLGIIHAVAADVPAAQLDAFASHPAVSWVSLDAPVSSTARPDHARASSSDNEQPANVYRDEIDADEAWTDGDFGQGVTVAVVDTGIADSAEFRAPQRVVATVSRDGSRGDGYGHGTHVAGLIGANGVHSQGAYAGVAPQVDLVNVKIGDDSGAATIGDVINGLQYVLENKDRYNIRVVNLSLVSDVAQSYTTDPLDAAVELLTFRGILVVVAAGNDGAGAMSYAPANDPFVITVGALDDAGTPDYRDDVVPAWSSRGATQDGFAKPEVYAPGRGLISVLSPDSLIAGELPDNVVDRHYLRLSGTSMAAAVTSGAAALVIAEHRDWTPGQVKAALIAGADEIPAGDGVSIVQVDGASELDAIDDPTPNVKPNYLLLTAAGVDDPASAEWDSIRWGSIRWGSIRWGSIRWGSIRWGSIRWGYVAD